MELHVIGSLVSSIVVWAFVSSKGNICISKLLKLGRTLSGEVEVVTRGVCARLSDPGFPINSTD